MKFIFNNTSIKMLSNGYFIYPKISSNEDVFSIHEVPYISTHYFNPKPYNDESVIIPFYVTDFFQKEYFKDDYSETFTLEYEVDGVKNVKYGLKGGDNVIDLGVFQDGEHWFGLQIIDSKGRKSHKLYNEFYTVDRVKYPITESQTYIITETDLNKYGIKNNASELVQDMTNTREGLTFLFDEIKNNGYRKCILLNGIYIINNNQDEDVSFPSYNKPVIIPSDFTVDLNGSIIKLYTNESEKKQFGLMIDMRDCFDSHVVNGIIEGNVDVFDASDPNGEHLNTTNFRGCKYSSFKDLTIRKTTGYTSMTEIGSITLRKPISSSDWKYGINVVDGVEVNYENKYTCNHIDISNMLQGEYLSVNRFLGYQGFEGDTFYADVHFYDKDKNFIETVKSMQYRKIRIPLNSFYIRATIDRYYIESGIDMQVTNFSTTTNCSLENIKYEDTRVCAIAPKAFNNLLIKDCTFNNCGYTPNIAQMTCIAIDFEDCWEMGQDCYFMNNSVIKSAGTRDLVTCRGMNYVIENCDNFRTDFRAGTIAPVYRNNTSNSFNYYKGKTKKDTCFGRVRNNIFNNGASIPSSENDDLLSAIRDCAFINSMPSGNKDSYFLNCEMDLTTLQDFSASTYLCDNTKLIGGKLYGLKAKNALIGNIYANGTEIYDILDIQFPKGLEFENCNIHNSIIRNHNYDKDFKLKDCNISNSNINFESWITTISNLYVDNCNITNLTKFANIQKLNGGIVEIKNSNIKIENDSVLNLKCQENSYVDVALNNNEIDCKVDIISNSGTLPTSGKINIVNRNNTILNGAKIANDLFLQNDYVNIIE